MIFCDKNELECVKSSPVFITKKDYIFQIENAIFISRCFYRAYLNGIFFSGQKVYHFKNDKGFFEKLTFFSLKKGVLFF